MSTIISDISALLNTRQTLADITGAVSSLFQLSWLAGPASAESRSFSCVFYSVNMCYFLHSSVISLAELTLRMYGDVSMMSACTLL